MTLLRRAARKVYRKIRKIKSSQAAPVTPQAQPTMSVCEMMARVGNLIELSSQPDIEQALPWPSNPVYPLEWGTFRRYTDQHPQQDGASAPEQSASTFRIDPAKARKITIIVLTWNGIACTRKCLDTLRENTLFGKFEVLVVDNGSRDGTVEYLKSIPWIRTLFLPENVGFVRGNNRGLAICDPESDIILLNNDIEIYQPDWLDRLQATAYSAPDIGVVGCRLRRPGGVFQHAGTYLPLDTFWGQQIGGMEDDINQYNKDRDVEGVVFASVYLKRELINKIGGLDEDYFSYFEDTDYCLKARKAGYRTVCCGTVTLEHHENYSTKVNQIPVNQFFQTSQATFKRKWEEELRRERYKEHLDWRSIINLPTGYSISSRELVLALDRAGVEVAYRYVYGPGTVYPLMEPVHSDSYLINSIRTRSFSPQSMQVVYAQGDVFAANDGAYKVGFTMLEVDGFPKEWVRQANMMDEVWVPSTFNVETMRSSGVTRPIHVIPLGVDPAYFHPDIEHFPHRKSRTIGGSDEGCFVFLSVFEWGERKAPEILLKAFSEEFSIRDDVVLVCKVINRDGSVNVHEQISRLKLRPDGGRIILSLNDVIPSYQLGSLYRSADCFVLSTRGEGWGMPVLEAMACGLPVIATAWGAQMDFYNETVGYPLSVEKLSPAQARCPYYTGFRWADPSLDHLRILMRHVFEHPEEARHKGQLACQEAHSNWTWDHSAKRIRERIRNVKI